MFQKTGFGGGHLVRRPSEGDQETVNVVVAERNSSASSAWGVMAHTEEREHELRAALFGIESAAEVLTRHRGQMTDLQFDDLTRGVLAEVRRLRGLLAGHIGDRDGFDLAEAIDPVIACARSSGLEVRSSVPRGIDVDGCRASTAQVVLTLLDNARRHAAPSPVDLRVTVIGDIAALYVEDRGNGLGGQSPERLFDRGVRGDDSSGSGLGLFIARRLMGEQGGSIAVRHRVGGGASFVARFRRASANESKFDQGAGVRSLTRR
jgi:signal transduction histidine kinase